MLLSFWSWLCIRRERTLSDESSLRSWQRESQWRE